MKEYLVLIKDFTDPECYSRRMAVREQHLANSKKAKQEGKHMIMGGGLADKDGKLVASSILFKADTKDEIMEILKKDIYVESNVWDLSTVFIAEIN
ncbi:hypothetical protein BB559_001460 [Furculomyces boomerangus]|uniref:YCII-related domain-containing protein n=2 Tax=Harpellales TaxID=61421 RepID=A0A2T9Z1V2_9FUNG|nr:hypothetical protein BB559_001460 [Furculomyces boomerangus]PWA01762.1 hypothetical protein BB558_002107 [Smittium angustum]PWA03102.1 hypothetical protein BB558_000724 [Smittium angustum]